MGAAVKELTGSQVNSDHDVKLLPTLITWITLAEEGNGLIVCLPIG